MRQGELLTSVNATRELPQAYSTFKPGRQRPGFCFANLARINWISQYFFMRSDGSREATPPEARQNPPQSEPKTPRNIV